MDNENPFAPVVARMGERFAQPAQQPQFGLAEVLAPEPLSLRYAGQVFDRREIKINYTLEKHIVGADAQSVHGDLYGPTDLCAGGYRNSYHQVNAGGGETVSCLESADVEITPSDIAPGDLLFVYFSQADQMLVALCKVV